MLRLFSVQLLVIAVLVVAVPGVWAQEEESTSKMYFDVGNPTPGDTIHVGGLAIQGIAFDGASDEAPGIERIDIFLDDRDSGGMLIGHGTPGASTPTADNPALANSGWTGEIMLTRRMIGEHTMFFYALSGVTGEELVVAVPIRVVP